MNVTIANKRKPDDFRDGHIVRGEIIPGVYQLCVVDCYAVKDKLKAMGYSYDGYRRGWYVDLAYDQIGNALADLTLALGLTYREYRRAVLDMHEGGIDISGLSLDEAHRQALEEHFAKHKEG